MNKQVNEYCFVRAKVLPDEIDVIVEASAEASCGHLV